MSAFAPVVNPMNCPWGQNAFTSYLGDDSSRWRQYDACELVANGASRQRLFIDQGEADQFLEEQLMPER
ncbi:alpha/beta hydrolase-fold protein, partial [Escherichia coli]